MFEIIQLCSTYAATHKFCACILEIAKWEYIKEDWVFEVKLQISFDLDLMKL